MIGCLDQPLYLHVDNEQHCEYVLIRLSKGIRQLYQVLLWSTTHCPQKNLGTVGSIPKSFVCT